VRYQVVKTAAQLRQAVDFLLTKTILAADIETSGYNPRANRILCLAVSWAKNRALIIPLDEVYVTRWKWPGEAFLGNPQLRRLLSSRGPTWVWHNGKFDASFFRTRNLPARVDEDTMLMHYAINEQRGTHDLKQLAQDLLGATDYSQVLKKYAPKRADSYENVPPDILFRYAAQDTDSTFQIYGLLESELGNGLGQMYRKLLVPASAFLQEVEAKGVWVHRPSLDHLERELTTDLGSKLKALRSQADGAGWDADKYANDVGAVKTPTEFNPGSPKQVMWVLRRLGIKVKTTNQVVLKDIRPRPPFVTALLAYRATAKALSTYAYGIGDAADASDGRVHSTYLIHGTTTGRLSSRNPNMQNMPRVTSGRWGKMIRDVFQAAPGNQLLEFDYSQAELRVLAFLSQDEGLIDIYRRGLDLHDEVATAIFGSGFTKEQRVRAKFVNFGIAYGRGGESLAQEFKISRAEGSEMVRAWFARFPQAHVYLKAQRQAVVDGRTLVTPLGRRRRFGVVTRESLITMQNEAANFAIQSTASDLTLLAAMSAQPRLREMGGSVINLIHDSILVEAPKLVPVDKVAAVVRGTMEAVPRRVLGTEIPFESSMATGSVWGSLE
jgi:DNA polymerase-1